MSVKNAYTKDIFRTIGKGRKRFFSLLLITMLGVMTMTGVTAACTDLRKSADRFFDEQSLYDLSVVSTMGLTDGDVQALADLDGVTDAEGVYSATVDIDVNGTGKQAQVRTLSGSNINEPYLLHGRLPEKEDEIAVTQLYIADSGKSVGDTLSFEERLNEEGQEAVFRRTSYTITGVVTDPLDVNSAEGSSSFRSTALTDYTFFILPEAADSDIYTAVYLKMNGLNELDCYSDEYKKQIEQTEKKIEDQIKTNREQARDKEISDEANAEVDEAEADMLEEFAKADREIADARAELEDGRAKLEDGQRELEEQQNRADQEFADARAQLEEGRQQLEDGEKQLKNSEQQISEGERQAADGRSQLEQQEKEAKQKIEDGRSQLEQQEKEAKQKIEDSRSQLEQQKEQTQAGIAQVQQSSAQAQQSLAAIWPQTEWDALVQAAAGDPDGEQVSAASDAFVQALQPGIEMMTQSLEQQLEGLDPESPEYETQASELKKQIESLSAMPQQLTELGITSGTLQNALMQIEQGEKELKEQEQQAQLQIAQGKKQLDEQEQQVKLQFAQAWETLEANEQKLAEGREELEKGKAELEQSRQTLQDGETALNQQERDARSQIEDGWNTLEQNRKKLDEGEAELASEEKDYEQQKKDAQKKIADARQEIADLDKAQWYIQDRSSLSGYNNIESDSTSIEALGTAFPVVFFIVAILIGLTTITRMVEEERGMIGTYKALGFSNREIRRKYVSFALAACIAGGAAGDICGFIVLPNIIFSIFRTMYLIPEYSLHFQPGYGFGSILLFLGGITGAAVYACQMELKHMPAVLMRPKTPHVGARVFLERIPFIWKRFSFLNKVTARNIFRYKKRLLMTVAGIMGCTALVICGFTIKDTVSDLLPKQYENIYRYDLMAVASADKNQNLLEHISKSTEISDYINVLTDSVTLINQAGTEEKTEMTVVPGQQSLDGYIRLETLDGDALTLKDGQIYVTQNAAEILNAEAGDTITIQNSQLDSADIRITEVAQNYLGNMVYMTQGTYEQLFGTFQPNSVLAHFSEDCTDETAYINNLQHMDGMVSVVSIQEMRDSFADAFYLVNMVVYLILILAAGLAFVVLFTLSTTNISERVRELATIKVLGFYNSEVHMYVNKETMILTVGGILLGLPFGYVIGHILADVLDMPSIQFVASLHPISYVISAVLSFCFALIVNLVTNRILNRIDMVEALKSIE